MVTMVAPAVEAIGDSTGLRDRDWLGAPAAASPSTVAVAVACSGAGSGFGSVSALLGGTGAGVDILTAGVLAVVGVLGLLLLPAVPALFCRMRSTSDGRGLKVGRKPSIQ